MPTAARAPLILTPGDPAGIGAEIALQAWMRRAAAGVPPFLLLDDPARLARLAGRLGWDVPIETVAAPAEALGLFGRALPVLPTPLPWVEPGRPDSAAAGAVVATLERGVALVEAGQGAALVTNPIAKSVLWAGGFRHPGHTEWLAARTKAPRAVMLLAGPQLMTVPVTIHEPLARVPALLTTALIVETARIVAEAGPLLGLPAPVRLAVAGLNPHAGESGGLGTEDRDVIAPAVAWMDGREGRPLGRGPLPADTMFHAQARGGYDIALGMYHDQALIPVKLLGFDDAVNVTLGLPIIRTSPDHGTAFDLAGQGRARPDSLIAALRMAAAMAGRRG